MSSTHYEHAQRIRERALREAREGWGDFLCRLPFEWFLTLTFSTPIHPEQAAKRWRRWTKALESHPDRAAGSPLIWARAEELQTRGVIHFHALLAGVAGIPRMAAIKQWERLGGGWARIDIYRHDLRGSYYVAKRGEIELSATWFGQADPAKPTATDRSPR